jgi:hypothetical protein
LKCFHASACRSRWLKSDQHHETKNQKVIILATKQIPHHDFVKPVSYGRFIQMERRIAQAVKVRLWAIRIPI